MCILNAITLNENSVYNWDNYSINLEEIISILNS